MDRRVFGGLLGVAGIAGAAPAASAPSRKSDPASIVDVRTFGAIGDGRADDTQAIQAAIDFALRERRPTVNIPAGTYRTTDTLHLGYGDRFTTISLVGEETFSYAGLAGTVLKPDALDRPALNIQGGRGNVVRGLSFAGRNVGFIGELRARGAAWCDPDPAAWLRPELRGGLRRTLPYCAIAVDGFSGPVQPGLPKPPVPAAGLSSDRTQRRPSFDIVIDRCWIGGFAIAVAIQPCDFDANGDYVKITRCSVADCAFGVAIGNAQSRNVAIRDCFYANLQTFITNKFVGMQRGLIGGPIDNLGGVQSFQTFDIAASTAGPLTISNLYFEAQARVGNISMHSGFNHPVVFQSCHFYFVDKDVGLSPPTMVTCGPTSTVKFLGCTFNLPRRFCHLVENASFVDLESCMMGQPHEYLASGYKDLPAGVAKALDYTCGGLFVAGETLRGDIRLTNGIGLASLQGGARAADSPRSSVLVPPRNGERIVVHHYAREMMDRYGRLWSIRGRRRPFVVGKPAGRRFVASDTIEMNFPAGMQAASQSHCAVGDILHDSQSSVILVVTALERRGAALLVRALQMTGLRSTADGARADDQTVSPGGHYTLYHTDDMVSDAVWYGDFKAGSDRVANVHSGDGRSAGLQLALRPGDILYDGVSGPPWPGTDRCQPYPAMTSIAEVDEAAGVVTLDKTANAGGRFPLSNLLLV